MAGQTRIPGMDDYIMFSPATQTPIQRKLSYSPDTEETLRLATQKLKQPQGPTQSQAQALSHAYVIPVPIVPSDNYQSIATQQSEQPDIAGMVQPQYQFATAAMPDNSTQVCIFFFFDVYGVRSR